MSQKLSSFYAMNLFFSSKYQNIIMNSDFMISTILKPCLSHTHTSAHLGLLLIALCKDILKKTKVHSMVHQFKFLLMKVTNQPIIRQELHVVKHVIMIKMSC